KQFDAHLKPWAGRRLSSITFDDVDDLHKRIGKAHPYMANRVVALVQAMYSVARANREIRYRGENPAEGVERFREESKVRWLSRDEAARLMAAIKAEPNRMMAD